MIELLAVVLALIGIAVAIFIPIFVEAQKRPVLRIERADDLNARDRSPHWRIVHCRVINEPISGRLGRWLLRSTATTCKVTVAFTSRSDGKVTSIPGRWSAAPEPFSLFPNAAGSGIAALFDPTKVPQTLRLDLSADPVGEVLGIAIKADGDREAFAFTSESYRVPTTLRLTGLELSDEEYDVSVTARAGGLETTAHFTLHNEGSAHTGLTLAASET